MTLEQLRAAVTGGAMDSLFAELYGKEAPAAARKRCLDALSAFEATFDPRRDGYDPAALRLFSVPGRSEIAGNHTDHNHGKVMAASIDLDIIAVAAPTADGMITVKSKGFNPDRVVIRRREAAKAAAFTSAALIAGVADGFLRRGFAVGGFVAYTESRVFKGSGLSSSAAFEVMIGNILRTLWSHDPASISNVDLAKIAQYAENEFFGKPCGLMDQMACAVGGFIAIDFADPTAPKVTPLDFDLSAAGYSLCILDTGGNHADLNEEYAAIPAEMKAVAACLGANVLAETDKTSLVAALPRLRPLCGDRAILRALHFFAENDRVQQAANALSAGDLPAFLAVITASGASSFRYLQNVYAPKNPAEQGLSLALCLTEDFLASLPSPAACRVHGGGFAGTIQTFLPASSAAAYRAAMAPVFGENACHVLAIRRKGAVCLV